METIKVNMTPCEDVQTIHASQNDSEAREWGFELHNNGDVIDSSEITDQIVFKAYEGGTEELLPSSLMNGSVDLGSLAWTYMPNNYFRSTSVISDAKIPSNENTVANILCSILKSNTANNVYANNEGVAIDGTGRIRIYYDDMPTDVASFTQAMQGVLLWYEKSDSTPTTTPFLGDIKYPQGLLTNQQFTYRESPTEEDGLANIVSIKGQTLKWNQLANISDSSFTNRGITVTKANGKISYSGTTTAGSSPYIDVTNSFIDLSKIIAGHKYLISVHDSADGGGWNRRTYIVINNPYTEIPVLSQTASRTIIFTPNATPTYALLRIAIGTEEGVNLNGTASVIIVDITQMGLDSLTDVEILQWFADYFPLSYYPFNNGSLIPFMGNGIKTVGKNLFDESLYEHLKTDYEYEDSYYHCRKIQLIPNTTYTISSRASATSTLPIFINNAQHVNDSTALDLRRVGYSKTLTTDISGCLYIGTYYTNTDANTYERIIECQVQIEYGTAATSYEPYTSSTLSLPISTYFPSGMKSAGSVYDEWTPNKAIPRVGTVTLNGTEDWRMPDSSGNCWMNFDNMPVVADYTKTMTATVTVAKSRISMVANSITGYNSGTTNYLYFRTADATQTNDNVKAYLQANPVTLNYELKTPTETSFTTASLVTENAEIPLSNGDGTLVGKCTEELSAEPGFHDAKIKLSDSDGTCYSNKLQLHVERSPQ